MVKEHTVIRNKTYIEKYMLVADDRNKRKISGKDFDVFSQIKSIGYSGAVDKRAKNKANTLFMSDLLMNNCVFRGENLALSSFTIRLRLNSVAEKRQCIDVQCQVASV